MTTVSCNYELIYVVGDVGEDKQMELLDAEINIGEVGRLTLAFLTAKGATPLDAAKHGYAILLGHGVRVLRAHLDLVTQAQIAGRSGYSRAGVLGWVQQCHSIVARFPCEHAWVGNSPVWVWAEVNEWLRRTQKKRFDQETGLDRAAVGAFNQWLLTAPRTPRSEPSFGLAPSLASLERRDVSFV